MNSTTSCSFDIVHITYGLKYCDNTLTFTKIFGAKNYEDLKIEDYTKRYN